MSTIYALASAQGKAGVSVIRISGENAHEAASSLCGVLPPPRRAAVRTLRFDGEILDEALVLVFKEGESFTGEASVELQVHGGRATVAAVLRALGAVPGLRLAEPGEFSRRALESGRMDLTQIEGLADLIDAETEAQRRQAVALLGGALGRRAEGWRADLVHALALLEATIDFSEEDVPEAVLESVSLLVSSVCDAMLAELKGAGAAERIRDGFEVAIVGAPNVGKSTLLNAIAGREAAIVSEFAGTTRDVIEVRLDIAGLAVTLLDTAGLREADDFVERRGIDLALARAQAADLRVFLMDGEDDLQIAPREGDLIVLSKADQRAAGVDAVSGVTGQGVDRLLARLAEQLQNRASGSSFVIRERHRLGLEDAVARLRSAMDMIAECEPTELISEEVRCAMTSVEVLIGRVGVEDLLGEIFSRFCIGK